METEAKAKVVASQTEATTFAFASASILESFFYTSQYEGKGGLNETLQQNKTQAKFSCFQRFDTTEHTSMLYWLHFAPSQLHYTVYTNVLSWFYSIL